MGYASYMCLAATFANLPICTIFDTYFTVLAPFAKNIYIRPHCGRQNHRILTPFELGGPPEMPNKCITTNLPPHQYLRWGESSIFKKTHPRNGGNKIFDRSHMGMGYASYMCLVAPIANLPICTIFDTYFQFYFWPKRKKEKIYFGGQNTLEIGFLHHLN